MEAYLAQFADCPGWNTALRLILRDGPPTGRLEDNRRLAHAAASRSPLMALLPPVVLGGDGLPRYRFTSDAGAEFLLLQVEEVALAVRGPMLVEVLRRIWKTFGPIGEDELVDFLADAQHVERPVATSVAQAFLHFWRLD
jgi:hypothetical protein